MPLKFYNTLTRRKEEFRPIKKGQAGIYSCGPTVYNYAHIGNFRAYMVADVLRRYLKFSGFKVRHVMNLTDVDDKTIKGAQDEGISLAKFTEKYKKSFFEDLDTLQIERVESYPAATETIPEMVALVKKLLKKGVAYKSKDGSIYYSVSKFKDYGKLSHLHMDELKEGARVAHDEYEKGSARDFALWKAWSEDDKDVFWETEIGKGRPGWHIECSAMSMKNLSESFDIHTGGIDLIFPHHENEIAQSEAGTGKKFVNYWLHNAYLVVEGEKMSKSKGNFHTLRDLKEYSPRALRFVLLNSQYRQELNFTFKGVKDAEKTIERIDGFVKKLQGADGEDSKDTSVEKLIQGTEDKFQEAMDDDLNVPEALAAFFEFMPGVNALMSENKLGKKTAGKIISFLQKLNTVLGIMQFEFKEEKLKPELMNLVQEREKCRKDKQWKKADEIRETLKKKGVLLDDTAEGTKWKKSGK